jgi:hypothetical protein
MIEPAAPPQPDATVLLLQALAWICSDDGRADRLLAVTGLNAAALRERALDPDVLAAVGDFLMAHEPDLVACAAALDIAPTTLAGTIG